MIKLETKAELFGLCICEPYEAPTLVGREVSAFVPEALRGTGVPADFKVSVYAVIDPKQVRERIDHFKHEVATALALEADWKRVVATLPTDSEFQAGVGADSPYVLRAKAVAHLEAAQKKVELLQRKLTLLETLLHSQGGSDGKV
jgi:hypothetical protein